MNASTFIIHTASQKKPAGRLDIARYGTIAEDELHSSVAESVSKIVVHSTGLIRAMLVDGDMPGLLATLAGLAFARNKIWFYNETIIAARTKSRPFTDRYEQVSIDVSFTIFNLFTMT